MGENVKIAEVKYLYPDTDRPLWQIDVIVDEKNRNDNKHSHRIFIEPKELVTLLGNALAEAKLKKEN